MMIKYNFIKTLTAGFALAMAIYPQVWAGDANIISGESCNNKCVWEYDTSTHDMIIKPKTGVTGDINVGSALRASFQSKGITEIQNATLAEGITGYDSVTFDSGGLRAYGTLKLPNSLKNITQSSTSDVGFRTVEISAENLETVGPMTLRNVQTFILTPAEGKNLPSNFFGRNYGSGISWGNYWENYDPLNIQCKGNLEICRQNVLAAKGSLPGTIDYYEERDADDNVVLKYHDTGYYTYDSQGNITGMYNLSGTEQYDEKGNILAKYDTNGNLLASYDYAADGSVYTYDPSGKLVGAKKTTPFTPAEAAALVKKGNNNIIKMTFK